MTTTCDARKIFSHMDSMKFSTFTYSLKCTCYMMSRISLKKHTQAFADSWLLNILTKYVCVLVLPKKKYIMIRCSPIVCQNSNSCNSTFQYLLNNRLIHSRQKTVPLKFRFTHLHISYKVCIPGDWLEWNGDIQGVLYFGLRI